MRAISVAETTTETNASTVATRHPRPGEAAVFFTAEEEFSDG
ncbi:MAG: hypothetical protein SFY95_01550 [Planctomycetota bacterium]|nr:hypothetical protein [Planctomycetota bacterium]